MDADLDTLATALYARIDDTLKARPDLVPWRRLGRLRLLRVALAVLLGAAAIWHNHHSRQPVLRSLTAYDH